MPAQIDPLDARLAHVITRFLRRPLLALDSNFKTSIWVAEHITKERVPRKDAFKADINPAAPCQPNFCRLRL